MLRLAPRPEFGDEFAADSGQLRLRHLMKILAHRAHDGVGRPIRTRDIASRRGGVHASQTDGEVREFGAAQTSGFEQPIELHIGWKRTMRTA